MTLRAGKAVFVTGTDTGIGKTMISCAIAAGLHARGVKVGVYKPVETGCAVRTPSDVPKLIAAAGAEQPLETAVSYLFELPAAPLVAAEAAGATIDPRRIESDFGRVAAAHDFVIVEGAGGLLVPIAERYTYLDLARALELPAICVIGSRLGCINHALLTLAMLGTAAIPVRGYVVNQLEAGEEAAAFASSNRATIARFTGDRDLGAFPHVGSEERMGYALLGRLAEQTLELAQLM